MKRENISLDYLKDSASNYIIIRLENDYFEDLFDDLIASIYHQIEREKSATKFSEKFISTFHKWSDFFDSQVATNLSPEALQGLMGELIYLGQLLDAATAITVNDMLESWRGPYGDQTDFILADKRVEVKAVCGTSRAVRISSEFQLEKELGLGIELVVISLEKDPSTGLSIKEKLTELKDCVLTLCGDISIVLKALKELEISYRNIGNYDNIRFRYVSTFRYDAALEGFPKIVRSSLQNSIRKVKYSLMLTEISEYIILDTAENSEAHHG